jgi:hypothetical protein
MKYYFRGIVIFHYQPETKEMLTPTKDGLPSFNFCQYIPDDYLLMSDFFKMAHLHAIGQVKTEDLKDVEVY